MYELTQSLSEAFAVLNSCGSPVFLDFDWRQRLDKSELFAGALFADPMLPPKMEDWNMEQWNGAEVFLVHRIMQTLPPFTRCGGISGGFLAARNRPPPASIQRQGLFRWGVPGWLDFRLILSWVEYLAVVITHFFPCEDLM